MNNDMNNIQTNIEKIVMRRVHRIRVLRVIISGGVFAALLSVLLLWGIGREVWVAHVFQNAPTNFADIPNFYLAAFLNTRPLVQVLIFLTLASFIYFVRELARLVIGFFVPDRA